MKRQLFNLLFTLLGIIAVNAQDLCICTYNVRYKNSGDTDAGNGWDARKAYLINFVNFQQPDLLGVQEATNAQMNDMANGLSGYAYVGVGRNDGKTSGEYSAIFYRKERMVLLDNGDFWLSDTPYKPSKGFPSKGGSTTYYRICSWGKFYDKATGVTLFHFNTHLDLDETNRQQSFYLIKQKIQELASTTAPVIITGDYNAVQTGEAYKLFLNSGFLLDSYVSAKQKFISNGTCPGFNANSYSTVSSELRRIDHIFVTQRAFNITHYAVLNPCYYSTSGTADYNERAYSDHSPVLAKLTYKNAVSSTELPTTPPPIVDGIYQISTPEELQAFSFIVNGVAGFAQRTNAKAVLLNDIDMTGMTSWLPIGTNNKPFTGTFDGQGYSIKDIAIKTSKSYSGFFGKVMGATIKNFHISGTLTVSEGYTEHGVVGYADGSTITDVHSSLKITANKANNDTQHIGGIVGSMFNSSTVTRCSFDGTISDAGTNTVGGIVGYADGTNNNISYCINYGTVKSNGSSTNTGGILGYVNYAGFKISFCANTGSVTANTSNGGQIVGRQVKAMTTLPSDLYYIGGTSLAAFGSATNETSATGATVVSANDVTSGELTYLLNEGREDEDVVFLQNLDEGEQTDPHPIIGGYPEHKVVHKGVFGKQKNLNDNTNYSFYVNENGRLASLPLVNYFSTPVDFTADYASYTGESIAKWGAIYLPFAAESSENVQLYELVPELTEGSVLAIVPRSTLPAYTPGLYQILGGAFEVEAYNTPVAVPPTDVSVSAGNFLLKGTLDKLTASGGYVYNNGAFRYTSDNIAVNAFEAHLTANGEQPEEITLLIVDATGIHEVQGSQLAEQSNNAIYNLSGQRLDKILKGVNIINGKKYIIK